MPRIPSGILLPTERLSKSLRIHQGQIPYQVEGDVHSLTSKIADGSTNDAERLEAIVQIERDTGQSISQNVEEIGNAITISSNSPTTSITQATSSRLLQEAKYGDEPSILTAEVYEPTYVAPLVSLQYGGVSVAPSTSINKTSTTTKKTTTSTVYGGGCFLAGTLVDAPLGPIPIEEIKVGDLVNVEFGWAFVKNTVGALRDDLVAVRTSHDTILCSPNHRFATLDGWCEAGELKGGDRLSQGQRVNSVGGYVGTHRVYNFDVDHPSHVYLVSGHLVHNYKSVG